MALPALPIITGLFELGKNWLEGKQKKRERKDRIDEAKTQAIIQKAENGQLAEINWDKSAVDQMAESWKDEFWTVVLAMPAIFAFLGFEEQVMRGFTALNNMPDWYQAVLGVAIAAAFGYRKIVDIMTRRGN